MPRKGRNIYKRKDNRWEARVYYTGCKKYRAVYGKTFKEAVAKQDKLRLEMGISGGNDYPVNTLAEQWLEDKSFTVKKGSLYSYENKLNNHILPYFSEVYFSKLNEQMLSGFVSAKRAENLSEKYISDMLIMIKSISAWANKKYGMHDKIKAFKFTKPIIKEPEMLSAVEQKKLQQHLMERDDSVSLGIFMGMFTGLRIGELCAVKWSDLDFENGILTINKTAQRLPDSLSNKKTSVNISTPKTAKSIRAIPIPNFLLERLKQHEKGDECYILSSTEKLIEPRSLTYKFKRILSEAGVPPVKFHSLRHAFATNCIQNHFDIKTLSEILGHSTPNITLKIYLHSSLEQKRKCMDRLTLY